MRTFEEAWKQLGYQYGPDALENVKVGWDMAQRAHAEQRVKEERGLGGLSVITSDDGVWLKFASRSKKVALFHMDHFAKLIYGGRSEGIIAAAVRDWCQDRVDDTKVDLCPRCGGNPCRATCPTLVKVVV